MKPFRPIQPMLHKIVLALTFALVSATVTVPDTALAKRGGDELRTEFYGIVQAMPASGLHGEWLIGGQVFIADPGTQFDQSEGLLAVGRCAKVKIRNGRVHEIDSEPMHDCR